MRELAVAGFGPGMIRDPQIGIPCVGCARAIGMGDHGYLLSGRDSRVDVWHRSCFLDAAELTQAADWVQRLPQGGRDSPAPAASAELVGTPLGSSPVGAVAVERSPARSEHREDHLTLVAERDRIAQELNALVHSLFGIGLELQANGNVAADGMISNRIGPCIVELDACIQRLRQYVFFDLGHPLQVPKSGGFA